MENKRKYNRILFSAIAHLIIAEEHYETTLIDLSLKGALVDMPEDWPGIENIENREDATLSFTLSDGSIDITMSVSLAHEHGGHIGLSCNKIHIDSATHLRRIIELNLGDSLLLDRDFEHLAVPE